MKKWIVLVIVILMVVTCGILLFNTNVEVEYVPETEIGDVDLRKTMVSLYFQNKDSKELQKETRLIDSKELLMDPYKELIEMLIKGPESEALEKTIPEGTKLLGAELEGNCLKVNFSSEFIDNVAEDEKTKKNCIEGIVNTLTELNEVNSVKIMINGEMADGFAEVGIDLKEEIGRMK